MSSNTTIKSIGMHGHWGFSSAFDFAEALKNSSGSSEDLPEELNILLVSPSDIRHILCTISKLFKQQSTKSGHIPRVNFYLLETPIEVLARDLILLELFCDFELPVRQRATVFLEVFGNLKVQRRTNAYLEILSQRLRLLMAKGEGMLADIVDLSHLGYRERDYLEAALKNYDRTVAMDMDSWFDHRKRGLYEERYDNRKALFDWDYHSGVKTRASIVHIKQFKQWRESGIAYEFGDQEYVEPNKSLMTFAEGFLKSGRDKGLKKEVMGYWGDIVCSPYFAFGVDCDTPNKFAEGLFEIYNKGTGSEQQRHHAVEVALYQLFSFMWETETSATYTMTRANDVYSGLGKSNTANTNAVPADMEENEEKPSSQKLQEIKEETDKDIETEEDGDGNTVIVDENHAADATKNTETTNQSKTSSTTKAAVVTSDTSENEMVVSRALDTVEHLLGHLGRIRVIPLTIPANNANTDKKNTSSSAAQDSSNHTTNDTADQEQKSAIAQLLNKQKYRGLFHGVFISARYAQLMNYPVLQDILIPPTQNVVPIVAVETAKFLVPLTNEVKRDFATKIEEFASQRQQMVRATPVFRRRRDESDREDDVLFFQPATISSASASS